MEHAWILLSEDNKILFISEDKHLAKQVKKDLKPMFADIKEIEYRIL